MSVNTSGSVRRVPKVPMVMRSVRVPLALWDAVKTHADERGESISDAVRWGLEAYLRRK